MIDPASAIIARADIRFGSVQGSMKEIAFCCRLFIEDQSGLAHCDLKAFRHFLNDTLLKGKDGRYATAMERMALNGLE